MISRRIFFAASVAALLIAAPAFGATSQKGQKGSKKKTAKRPGKRKRAVPDPDLDPTQIVKGVYERAMKDVDGRVVTLSFAKDDRPRIFSAELAAVWDASDARNRNGSGEDTSPIDFDPVTNSQGLTVKSFKQVTEKQDESSATVAVTIEANEAWESLLDKTIRYDFRREANRWRIDDIRGTNGGKPWSVKGLLTRPRR